MNSIWLIIGSICAFVVAYRLYGAFLAAKVACLDDSKTTPAHRLNDGVDYHPTNKWVLFGVHFAAIAGPGPLVGPVLAAQWGYLPGLIWIIIGACLAGAVHDFVVLWASVRTNGKTLPQIAREKIGPFTGLITSIATLFIIVISLAAVGSVVLNVLAESGWSMFTILVTIPAALLTGLWMYKIRPGKVGEASAIGVTIVLAGVFLGEPISHTAFGQALVFDRNTLAIILPVYALIATILPVWILMCPRDYLSSYMKIGVMVVLGIGIVLAAPQLKMPATTPFLNGGGPVTASNGPVWPFVCIVIMCGAISGFHALIASGTTPKMVEKESHILPIGYGAMVLEGFVAITALVAACSLEPGDYFAINTSKGTYAKEVVRVQNEKNWNIAVVEMTELENEIGEAPRVVKVKKTDKDGVVTEVEEKVGGLYGREGGAVTLAVGMAKIFSSLPGLKSWMSYWYHFVTMFEALFILTLLETGTRVARFIFQEFIVGFTKKPSGAEEVATKPNWVINIVMSVLVCGMWGGLLYAGSLGLLWSMLGIANQLLASIALAVGTTFILMHAPKRKYAWCTFIPFVFVVLTTYYASIYKINEWIGFIHTRFNTPEKSFEAGLMKLVISLSIIMLVLVTIICVDSARRWIKILRSESDLQPQAKITF